MTIRLTRTAVLGSKRQGIADLLGACGTPARLEILLALAESSLEVGVLAAEIDRDVTHVSHQLKALRDASIVNAARQGSRVLYSLNHDVAATERTSGTLAITVRAADGSSITFAVQG